MVFLFFSFLVEITIQLCIINPMFIHNKRIGGIIHFFLAHLSTKCSRLAIVVIHCLSSILHRVSSIVQRAASTIALKAYLLHP